MPIFNMLKSVFAPQAGEPSSPPKLDGTSEAALSQSIGRLSSPQGWITLEEGRRLFSPMDDQYAFGEMDDHGNSNLARLEKQYGLRVDIMPTEGRIYLSRSTK
jgi:hypothetical protein